MPNRLKPVIILGFVLPGLFLVLAVAGSLELYCHTISTFRERQKMLAQEQELQKKLQSTVEDRALMQKSMKILREYFTKATTDGFISVLLNASPDKPEIISSSSIPQSSYESRPIKGLQQLTILGSSNTLITALGHAQIAFPAITPITWQLKKASKSEALELEARFIVPDITLSPTLYSAGRNTPNKSL